MDLEFVAVDSPTRRRLGDADVKAVYTIVTLEATADSLVADLEAATTTAFDQALADSAAAAAATDAFSRVTTASIEAPITFDVTLAPVPRPTTVAPSLKPTHRPVSRVAAADLFDDDDDDYMGEPEVEASSARFFRGAPCGLLVVAGILALG